jgi:hypothetical protein
MFLNFVKIKKSIKIISFKEKLIFSQSFLRVLINSLKLLVLSKKANAPNFKKIVLGLYL